jgi:hypothetical protein
MDVCLLCALSGRGLCDELITRQVKSYRLWRVVACDQETSWYEEAINRAGLQSQRNKQQRVIAPQFCCCLTEEACSHNYVVPEISDISKFNSATFTQLIHTKSCSHRMSMQIYLGSVHDGVKWDNAANIVLIMSELDHNFIFRFS